MRANKLLAIYTASPAMTHDDWPEPDEEDWFDEDDDSDDYESTSCPECGRTMYDMLDKCPSCGYWLSDDDRRGAWSHASPARWIKLTAILVLLVFLVPLVVAAMWIFGKR